nr:MAG: hypothetical protein [Chemarfal virus 195]
MAKRLNYRKLIHDNRNRARRPVVVAELRHHLAKRKVLAATRERAATVLQRAFRRNKPSFSNATGKREAARARAADDGLGKRQLYGHNYPAMFNLASTIACARRFLSGHPGPVPANGTHEWHCYNTMKHLNKRQLIERVNAARQEWYVRMRRHLNMRADHVWAKKEYGKRSPAEDIKHNFGFGRDEIIGRYPYVRADGFFTSDDS